MEPMCIPLRLLVALQEENLEAKGHKKGDVKVPLEMMKLM